jgi:hypothetical protein
VTKARHPAIAKSVKFELGLPHERPRQTESDVKRHINREHRGRSRDFENTCRRTVGAAMPYSNGDDIVQPSIGRRRGPEERCDAEVIVARIDGLSFLDSRDDGPCALRGHHAAFGRMTLSNFRQLKQVNRITRLGLLLMMGWG